MGHFRFSNFNPLYKTFLTKLSPPKKPRLIYIISRPNSPISPTNPNLNIPVRFHVGHCHHQDNSKEGDRVFKLGLAADIALASGKAITGYLSGSTAIIADAAHSISDIVLSGVALVSFRVARAPKDKEHPYGHGKFETLGALGISGMLLATAGGIGWHAIDMLLGLMASNPEILSGHSGGHHHEIDMNHPMLALNMMIASICVKEGLYRITKRAAEKQGSGLMMANAWHHRSDAVSSVVALVGVGGSILGVKFLDPLAGLVVSTMILRAGIETGYQSIMELVDAGVPQPLLDPIKQTIIQVEGVTGCHHIRGRRAGSSIYLDVHIEVDPFSSVSAAHDVGENVRHQIQKSHAEVAEVFIHIDPSLSGLSPKILDEETETPEEVISHQKDIEAIVSNILSSKFPKVMTVGHITHHSLRGKLFLQIEVSMPEDIMIRDAMKMAKEAEEGILKAASNLSQVSIQLRLGKPIPHHATVGTQ
ncbi:Metal tolerance protein C1 [Ranunculus cassubicifolius]